MNNEISSIVARFGGLSVERAGLSTDGVTFLLGGPDFSFWVLGPWRLVRKGRIVASSDMKGDAERLLKGRMVERIVAQSSGTGVDPAFGFGEGVWLEVFSDAWIDPWMLNIGDIRGVVGSPSGGEEWFERAVPSPTRVLDEAGEIAGLRATKWGGLDLLVARGGREFVTPRPWRVLSGTTAIEASSASPRNLPRTSLAGRKVIATRRQGSVLSTDRTLLTEDGLAIETFSTGRPDQRW